MRSNICLLFGVLPGCLAGAAEDRKEASSPVSVDASAGEVRIPSRFVNPTYKLEVFACHESGPTHETVVAFAAEGEEIYRALRTAGFRGPEHWNVTSPRDLAATGGDRAVVWLRWEWKGAVHEVPAEEILLEEGTGLPLLVRGFTFTAQPVQVGDPPRRGIPPSVELTIGGSNRQSPTFSMLQHANDFPEMVKWYPAPEVDPSRIPEFPELVEAKAPCTLIIRRVASEADLVDLLAERETLPGRKAFREAQRPLAVRIDEKKREFETLIADVRALLQEGEGRGDLTEEERKKFAARTRTLIARGGALAAEVRELYLRLLSLEEKHRLESIRKDPKAEAGLVAWAEMAYLWGFRVELAIASRSRELAGLADGHPGAGPADRAGLLRKALEKEIEALRLEQERRWTGFKLDREYRAKIRALDPKADAYVTRLFQESEMRALAEMRAFRSRIELARVEADELRARADGRSEAAAAVTSRRASAEAAGKLAAAETERVELIEKLRWNEEPPNPDEVKPGEKERLQGELRSAEARGKELRVALEKASGRPAGTGEEPPVDGAGTPLYPEDPAGD